MILKNEDEKLLGVVLSGGQSTRMGSDKGLLISDRQTWTQIASILLQEICPSVVISVNKTQLKSYQSIFPSGQLIVDNNELLVKGPLLGLLSVHQMYPEKDIFLLACDMIHMKLPVLQELKKLYGEEKSREAFVFINRDQPEPLCAIYKAPALSGILDKYKREEESRFSMKYILSSMNLFRIPLQESWSDYFLNINSPRDLKNL